MTVKEVIAALDQFPEDAEVVLVRKRTMKNWYAEPVDFVLDGNRAEMLRNPEEFSGKVVIR
jgi:hypothetical protein